MDMTRVHFLYSSEEINKHASEYWPLVLDIACRNNVKRIMRCSQIMGRDEGDEMDASQIFYPCMQVCSLQCSIILFPCSALCPKTKFQCFSVPISFFFKLISASLGWTSGK